MKNTEYVINSAGPGIALFFLVKKMFSETNDLNKSQNIEMAALIYFVRYSIILENNLYLEVFTWQL
ncbi:hypothetical protein B4099_0127 [Heyndrickxia coagulans]|uniref:Uncharacterized protein n=1 Tax=Heyndrickxia coagulans TaxID=1398 RepID=A0A150JS00_HEYCO|nr:hypothetical protein B4099_0127 [Heyndrickxia coagulans]